MFEDFIFTEASERDENQLCVASIKLVQAHLEQSR